MKTEISKYKKFISKYIKKDIFNELEKEASKLPLPYCDFIYYLYTKTIISYFIYKLEEKSYNEALRKGEVFIIKNEKCDKDLYKVLQEISSKI